MLSGQSVWLERDASHGERDIYARALRYVWLADGRLYQYLMVVDGYVHEYTFRTAYRYQAVLQAAEREAMSAARGFWAGETCAGDTQQPADPGPVATPTPTPVPATPIPAGFDPSAYLGQAAEEQTSTEGNARVSDS